MNKPLKGVKLSEQTLKKCGVYDKRAKRKVYHSIYYIRRILKEYTMKSTDNFKKVIQNYLQNRASSDTLFAVSFAKTNKNIDDCITYILNTVHKSGCSGFEDNEIFSMAVHYYDEGEFEVGGKIGCSVVTNHKAELTPEEIEEAKSEAKQKIIDDECARLREKQVKVSTVNIDKIEPCLQVSLF